jgi:hypothetical protein
MPKAAVNEHSQLSPPMTDIRSARYPTLMDSIALPKPPELPAKHQFWNGILAANPCHNAAARNGGDMVHLKLALGA